MRVSDLQLEVWDRNIRRDDSGEERFVLDIIADLRDLRLREKALVEALERARECIQHHVNMYRLRCWASDGTMENILDKIDALLPTPPTAGAGEVK
jgi:hypothetical protein